MSTGSGELSSTWVAIGAQSVGEELNILLNIESIV
jgi:hypothetical protein